MRKYYIDNLRTLVILLLFPFHTLRMFTPYEQFYVEGKPFFFSSVIISAVSLWFMNLLFVLAGMSTSYSLRKRSLKQYTGDRVKKLLIPFIFGVVLTIPIQTYYAERFHNGYTGGFLHQYPMFWTKASDLTGYRGGFTPAHLWFLLFLFIISMLSLPVLYYRKKHEPKPLKRPHSAYRLIPLFLLVDIFSVIELGEELGQYMTYFLIGFLVLTREETLEEIQKKKWVFAILAILIGALGISLNYNVTTNGDFTLPAIGISALRHLASWLTILALLGLGQRYLQFNNKWSGYMAKNSFSIYFVHQTLLVTIGFYIIPQMSSVIAIPLIILSGFVLSVLCCEILKRNVVTGFLFGMRK